MNRREALGMLAGAVAAALDGAKVSAEGRPMITRVIPSTGEAIPVIGMGSSNTFDVGASPGEREPLRAVLRRLLDGGGRVIDTSPMYGQAEDVLGDLLDEVDSGRHAWIATKVWTRGRDSGAQQIAESMRRLRVSRLDLLQIHNLLDWREHLPTIRALQQTGRLRYAGITHYRGDAHAELERVLGAERFDWVQFNYSLAERDAETRLLPHCRERGIAVMVNRPFADGAMFERIRGRALPPWAAEIGCASWAQFFLRYVLAEPAVTCVIPATARPQHMADNVAAGLAPLPDAGQRARMAAYWDSL